MKTTDAGEKTIAIIGGGVSGALVAYHLVRQQAAARVVVFEPKGEFGLGLAYSTPSLLHLLNVPAGKISALPDDAGHFLRWLRKNHDAKATGATFAPRAVFGRYVRSLVAEIEDAVEQEREQVVDLRREEEGAILALANGTEFRADMVVVATGNFDPAPLRGVCEEAKESGVYCHNAWSDATYADLAEDATVALIGTGLTAVDVVLRLRELGHRGQVIALSRNGLLPNGHAEYTPAAECAIPAGTQPTCVAYLRAFRAALKRGVEWRAAVDSLRAATNDLWLALPEKEQQRFRRHLQRRWEIVRHRTAPPIAAAIAAERDAGTLVVRRGRVFGVTMNDGRGQVEVKTVDGVESVAADRVINCTGPSLHYRHVGSALLESLLRQGLATPGAMDAGFRTSRDGAMIEEDGAVSQVLYNLGPGRLGTLLESIAVPEIREQAVALASLLKKRVGCRICRQAA